MKLLPIVPGCRALSTAHPVREVSVLDRYETTMGCKSCRRFGRWWDVTPKSAPDHVASCECILLRIDGDITEDVTEEIEA